MISAHTPATDRGSVFYSGRTLYRKPSNQVQIIRLCVPSLQLGDSNNNAERKEIARASESRQEGGDSDGESKDALGADGTRRQRRQERHLFVQIPSVDPPNPTRGPGGVFHELPCGRRILHQGLQGRAMRCYCRAFRKFERKRASDLWRPICCFDSFGTFLSATLPLRERFGSTNYPNMRWQFAA